ncbi:hypothetical protein E4U15_003314 [Claviceps sp. LM218 group G6]|nr:hypothetical protein E4U15_003314 [Claviceps sp. LM218 group G6]
MVRDPLFTDFLHAFSQLTYAPTVPVDEERLQNFKLIVGPLPQFKYCLKTWIQPWAEHFATTFIDQHRHFGLTTTSSAESMHANIKRHISGSTGDLRSATDGLVLFWKAQGARILAEETFS